MCQQMRDGIVCWAAVQHSANSCRFSTARTCLAVSAKVSRPAAWGTTCLSNCVASELCSGDRVVAYGVRVMQSILSKVVSLCCSAFSLVDKGSVCHAPHMQRLINCCQWSVKCAASETLCCNDSMCATRALFLPCGLWAGTYANDLCCNIQVCREEDLTKSNLRRACLHSMLHCTLVNQS